MQPTFDKAGGIHVKEIRGRPLRSQVVASALIISLCAFWLNVAEARPLRGLGVACSSPWPSTAAACFGTDTAEGAAQPTLVAIPLPRRDRF
jgi:hypothetical protein